MKIVLLFSTIVLLCITACSATCVPGPMGPNGLPGPEGSPGPIGSPGATIDPIQFCPGTPSYPSTFPEVGFCIDGNIYAVYSANDGFLTLIPPGEYESNAVGSSCDFTVLANCQIQN